MCYICRAAFFIALLTFLLILCACSSGEDSADGDAELIDNDADEVTDGDIDAEGSETAEFSENTEESGAESDVESGDIEFEQDAEEWVFDRSGYEPVNGWILLDYNPAAIQSSIEKAAEYGVNHIQLSHDIIMNIEDILGEDEATQARVETINLAIETAHDYGMKVYIWAHELSISGITVCFDPADPIWEERAEAYRRGLEKIPQLDGIILMYGSAPLPPWYAACNCQYCTENYEGMPWEVPPPGERLRTVTEKIGGVIVNELGLELFIRTFVHEPAEIDWHNEGLSTAQGLEFTAMHKADVQDWQPYNPPEACFGNIGHHAAVMETDVAGEYFGRSILPWCAPGYYWYRLRYGWDINAIGFVARIQRGSETALGTPNEVNIFALNELLKDIDKPLAEIWSEFIEYFYNIDSSDSAYPTLQRILSDTFDVRRKSHYVLGIWALEKSSDIPTSTELGEFEDRGNMPKWDPDWQSVWDSLNTPDKATVLDVWQESSEAVAIATEDLTELTDLSEKLSTVQYADLQFRLKHQKYAAEVWRAIKTFIWSLRAYKQGCEDCGYWARWCHDELGRIRQAMIDDGLENVGLASPARVAEFISNTASQVPDVEPSEPPTALFGPVKILETTADSVRLSFSVSSAVSVSVDYGLEIPDYGQTYEAGSVDAGQTKEITIEGLEAMKRYVIRLRAGHDGVRKLGGDYWIYTN